MSSESAEPDSPITEGMVSVVIPVFNRPGKLVKAVFSALEQTYPHVEVIIVDDGSTDETKTVSEKLAESKDGKVRVLHRENGGPGAARETGRLAARGEFVQYLDSDDILLPKKFELQVGGLRAHPECGVSYGKTRHHTLPPDKPWKRTGDRLDAMFPAFLAGRCWSTPTPLYRTTVIRQAGPWSTLRQEEDWEYDCRIAAQGIMLHQCTEFIAEIGSGDALSLSGSWTKDHALVRDRVEAHRLVLGHARKAGIGESEPEMRHFSRALFLLARQSGALGRQEDAAMAFRLSIDAAGRHAGRWDYRAYRLLAGVAGWHAAGRIARGLDTLRSAAKGW